MILVKLQREREREMYLTLLLHRNEIKLRQKIPVKNKF